MKIQPGDSFPTTSMASFESGPEGQLLGWNHLGRYSPLDRLGENYIS